MVDSSDSKEANEAPNHTSFTIEDSETSQDNLDDLGDRSSDHEVTTTTDSPSGSGLVPEDDDGNDLGIDGHGESSLESCDKRPPEYDVIVLSDSESSDYHNDLIRLVSSSGCLDESDDSGGELERRRIPTVIEVIDLTDDNAEDGKRRKRKRSLCTYDHQPKKMKLSRCSSCFF